MIPTLFEDDALMPSVVIHYDYPSDVSINQSKEREREISGQR